MVLMVIDSSDG